MNEEKVEAYVFVPEVFDGDDFNMYWLDPRYKQLPECPDFEDTLNKIFHVKAPEHLTSKFLERCRKEKDYGYQENLAGDLKEEYLFYLKEDENEFRNFWEKTLSNVYQNKVSDLVLKSVFHEERDIEIDIWANFMKPTESNPLHKHAGVYSYVWYLDVPEQIRDEHKYQPFPSRGLIEFVSSATPNTLKFNPKSGDILFFPSDTAHLVYPYYTPNERVSLAGNIYGMTIDDGKNGHKHFDSYGNTITEPDYDTTT